MKLVILIGPHAVGKMTVGQELCKITDLELFHNHMTIEPVCGLFKNHPAEVGRLTNLFRKEIFEAFAKTDEPGMVFTYMWPFDQQAAWDYVEWLEGLFQRNGAEVYYVELEADFDVRIDRNKTENRLNNKPSKRNVAKSEELFRRLEEKHRLNSLPGEIQKQHYLRMNNTHLSAKEAAERIKDHFQL
ncbi:MAG: shikimate kinase [Clostridiales bacterium]|nr:shikimate kinase [Clostridiales bacterium]